MTTLPVLIIELGGDFAHFKQYYTTTSPLTFPFPPPPTVVGMVGALLGLDKRANDYQRILADAGFRFGLALGRPLKKVRFSINLLDTDTRDSFSRIKQRTQIKTEFLKNPTYLLYLTMADRGLYEKLGEMLRGHGSFYTLSLGLAGLLANYRLIAETVGREQTAAAQVIMNSVVPWSHLQPERYPSFENAEIFKVRVPVIMNTDRVVTAYDDVFYDRRAVPMNCPMKHYVSLADGQNISFFNCALSTG